MVRLPLDYTLWTDPADPYRLSEPVLAEIDEAVSFGERFDIHVSLNFHRAPGYCVNLPKEPVDLWRSEEAQRVCARHWAHFADRYRGVPNSRLSFNLVNEPMEVSESAYAAVVRKLVGAIRERDPARLIIADGLDLAWTPVGSLADLDIGQSLHLYDPWQVSHWRAPWFAATMAWPAPTWPIEIEGRLRDKEALRRERIDPWRELEARGVGVHVGEFGTYKETPHTVRLAWMKDCLDLLDESDWGWALWNLRGSYGPLDSEKADVDYEDLDGHQVDRELLDLLLSHVPEEGHR